MASEQENLRQKTPTPFNFDWSSGAASVAPCFAINSHFQHLCVKKKKKVQKTESVTHILRVSKFFTNQFIATIPTSYSMIKHHNDPNFQSDDFVDLVLKPLSVIHIFYEKELNAPYQLL